MIRLIIAIIFLLASLLVLFRAPTNLLWMVAVAITNYPFIFVGLSILIFLFSFVSGSYSWAARIFSILSFVVFSLPIVAALRQKSTVRDAINKIFPLKEAESNETVFNFFKTFRSFKVIGSKEMTYKHIGKPLTLDFYPSARKDLSPLIIVVHGGSWESGNSKQLPELNSLLASRGYNVAAINYRLAPEFKAPAPVEDVHDAIEYLVKNSVKLQIDTSNIILLGRSAGAQIALNAAYDLRLQNIKGVISYYGPADMVWGGQVKVSKRVLNTDKIYLQYFGGNYEQVPRKFLENSPVQHVNASSPPTLIMHGAIDPLVSFQHAIHLNERLDSFHVKNYFLALPFATHGCDYNLNGPQGQVCSFATLHFIKYLTGK